MTQFEALFWITHKRWCRRCLRSNAAEPVHT